MARENPSWGYDRIQGALANWGHEISDQTVGNLLKAQGIEPVPERKRQTTWKTFIQSHWDVLGAIDFTTIEVWTKGGLVAFYLLFVMEIATRRVFVVWIATCLYAVYLVAVGWSRLATSAVVILDRENWLRLALAWALLKLLHELAHGLACKKYGGTVPAAGQGSSNA